MWQVGQRVKNGEYKILGQLGKPGGFGVTYKALQVSLGRPVAIKRPKQDLQDDPNAEKHVKQFRKEAKQLIQLPKSPHIVSVFDFFDEAGLPSIVMEFVEGKNLFELIKERGRLPEGEAVDYFRQVALALQVIHGAGMVHRDVHPGNIIVKPSGEVVLIDFGLATDIIPTTMSSKHYAHWDFAPYEQRLGAREPTVDIYALSSSLYYCLTGQLSAAAWDRRIIVKEKYQPDPFVSPINLVELTPEINDLICKGTALEAKRRHENIEEWLSMLQEQYKASQPKQKYVNQLPKNQNSLILEKISLQELEYSLIGVNHNIKQRPQERPLAEKPLKVTPKPPYPKRSRLERKDNSSKKKTIVSPQRQVRNKSRSSHSLGLRESVLGVVGILTIGLVSISFGFIFTRISTKVTTLINLPTLNLDKTSIALSAKMRYSKA
ncbi:MAG: serine/threonine protein kinase [Spirulina sp. SIO3F2]|nr:serine/threonine protein kinase [Spirulina sp. SIO3F2]